MVFIFKQHTLWNKRRGVNPFRRGLYNNDYNGVRTFNHMLLVTTISYAVYNPYYTVYVMLLGTYGDITEKARLAYVTVLYCNKFKVLKSCN